MRGGIPLDNDTTDSLPYDPAILDDDRAVRLIAPLLGNPAHLEGALHEASFIGLSGLDDVPLPVAVLLGHPRGLGLAVKSPCGSGQPQ